MIVFKILQKVLVNHFYKVNAGFFLFIFLLFFGLPYQPLSFHLSMINGIIESQVFLGVVFIGWLLYCLKCMDYIIRQIAEPQQTFLFCLNNLLAKKTYLYLVYVQVMVFMPALVYAGFIAAIATSQKHYACSIEVILFCIAIILLPAYCYLLFIQKRGLSNRSLLPASTLRLPKPLFLMPLFYLWHERKQMLLITKAFSLFVLYLFINLYEPDHYDVRPLLLCLLLVAGAHTAIIYQSRAFEQEFLLFSKNLPISTIKRFTGLTLMYAILLLPELMFLWKGYGVHFEPRDYLQLALMVLSLITLFHVILLMGDNTMDQFMQVVFAVLAALFFIILYDPGIVLPIGVIALSLALFSAYCYDFERKI